MIVAWGRVFAALGLVTMLGAGYLIWEKHVDGAGYARANAEWVIKEKAVAQDARDKAAEAVLKAQATERGLREKIDELTAARTEERASHEKNIVRHVNAALAQSERLSIAVASCPVPASGNSEGATAAARTGQLPRSDLLPGTAAAILRIAGDSAQLVRDYNAVVAQYRDVAAVCNGE